MTDAHACRAALAEAEREFNDQTAALEQASTMLETARVAFKDDPSNKNGKDFERAESAHKLATLAVSGAAERLEAARMALAKAERAQALAELAERDQACNLAVFEQHIAPHVARVLELRKAIADSQAQIAELVSGFTNGRQEEVLTPARELGSDAAEYMFEQYAAARLDGWPANADESVFIRRKPAARRNFGAELLNLSNRKAAERQAAEAQVTQA